jgi:hypothetical protein
MSEQQFNLQGSWDSPARMCSAEQLVEYTVKRAGWYDDSRVDRLVNEHAKLLEIVSKLVAQLPPNEVIELLDLADRCEPV